MGFKHCGAYAASKFGVEGLSLSVALEVEQFGIKVTIVEPGFSAQISWIPGTSNGVPIVSKIPRPRATFKRYGQVITVPS